MQEVWKDTVRYESLYSVSNLGNVIYKPTGEIKSLRKSTKGYSYIRMYRHKKKKYLTVHRLVAEAFIPNPDNKPFVNHINGIKTDNRVENLEWCTASENTAHAYKIGLRTQKPLKLTWEKVNKIRELFASQSITYRELGVMFNISGPTVFKIIKNQKWKISV